MADSSRQGTTISGASRSGSPRLRRRAICSSVNPSPRRSATHASCMASSRASRAASDDTITNRQGSLWCGAGAVSAAAIARSTAAEVDRLGGERADRAPGGQHVGRAEPEHVLARRPDQRPRAGPVFVGDQRGQPAHERDGHLPRLALDQVAGGRDLVGDRGDGDVEGVAPRVRLAAVVAHRQHAGRADRGVGLPGPPRPAQGVGDDDADGSRPSRARSALRSRRADSSGSSGSSTTVPGAVLDSSTPAAAITNPCLVCAIVVVPAPGHHAHGLRRDRVLAGHGGRPGPRPC